jgi:hypothetical protein
VGESPLGFALNQGNTNALKTLLLNIKKLNVDYKLKNFCMKLFDSQC